MVPFAFAGVLQHQFRGLARDDLVEPVHPQVDEVEEPIRVPERPLGEHKPGRQAFDLGGLKQVRQRVRHELDPPLAGCVRPACL